MRYPENERDENCWLEFILNELPDDPNYKYGKSAAAMQVIKMAHQIESLRDDKKGQAKQLRHMERRNVKLNQKITRLIKQMKKTMTKVMDIVYQVVFEFGEAWDKDHITTEVSEAKYDGADAVYERLTEKFPNARCSLSIKNRKD